MPDIGGGAFGLSRRMKSSSTSTLGERPALSNAEQRIAFVKDVYTEVQKLRTTRRNETLSEALSQSRDAVLAKARSLRVPNSTRVFPRLPSNTDASLEGDLCSQFIPSEAERNLTSPKITNETDKFASGASESVRAPVQNGGCETGRSARTRDTKNRATNNVENESKPPAVKGKGEDMVSVRLRNPRYRGPEVSVPARFLEGAHRPLPRSNATIFLKTHYSTEDQKDLTYVPYFGDDDGEDVVSELYNLEEKVKQVELGLAHEELDTNEAIDETIQLLTRRLTDERKEVSDAVQDRINEDLAELFEVKVERIVKAYNTRDSVSLADSSHEEEPKKNSSTKTPLRYEEVMDSYRSVFCRRCFTYDCNMHGNLSKPNIELQGELAVQKEREGYWERNDTEPPDATGSEIFDAYAGATTDSDQGGTTGSQKRPLSFLRSDNRICPVGDATELTSLQKSICDRAFLMFQGDTKQMAAALEAPHDLVAEFAASKKMSLKEFSHVLPQPQGEKNRKKVKRDKKSMKNYNFSWLKRVEDAEIHPMFNPCDHDGPCSEENCTCVRNRFFCTKHCVWGERSRNFFRGCSCKGAKTCRTKSCACFAAKRECDPDLCLTCGACTDPPNHTVTVQRCQNDSIGMRRHCHLLMAESTIPDAGWGIFTKHALKKGDFVHEYVGEVISQEEAERRGRIYDKVNRSYLFNLCSDYVVDASRKGNKTRYANHSSKPNCYTKMVRVNGDIRIGLFAKEDIRPQSELFFDYRYDVGMDNELIIKPSKTVDWMEDPKMANQISKKHRSGK